MSGWTSVCGVCAAAVAVGALGANAVRADITNWPISDMDWNAFTVGVDLYSDPVGDINPDWLDIVGDVSVHSAGYWAYSNNNTAQRDDDEIMWRIRLEEWKTNANVVWQVFMDVDGDDVIDYSMQLDGSGGNQVELVAATTGGTTWSQVSFDTTPLWVGSIAGFSRVIAPTGDGSSFGGGGDDVFLDIGMPWATFSSLTGASGSSPIRFGLSSSASHQAINKDLPFALSASDLVADGFTDPILGIPEPSTFSLLGGGLLALAWLSHRRPRAR